MLALVRQGLSSGRIAAALGLTPHRRQPRHLAMRKLGACTRLEAAPHAGQARERNGH